jgi:hypothetical protein
MKYDSTQATLQHIKLVANNLMNFCIKMIQRAKVHDESKLGSIEKPYNDEFSQQLYSHEYMSEEYKQVLAKMQPAVEHHVQNNSHHPEYYANGIAGMDLYDLVEMYCDWKAACLKNPKGNLNDSLLKNAERYNIEPQLYTILCNTVIRENYDNNK